MDVDTIAAHAREQSGLEDFGGDSWQEGLARLVDLANRSPFTDQGRDLMRAEYVAALVNRLRVVDHVSRHPEISADRIERPLVVLGMPRTGTTVTSYLLDQDPARRSLLNWEATDSVPPPTAATLRTDPRCLAKRAQQEQLERFLLDHELPMVHWEWADGPTECIFVQNQDFKTLYWDAQQLSPSYSEWLLNDADMTSAYEYERLVLQLLQSKAPGTWSLKMPSHAVYIETLLATFPGARLVLTHRDPCTALGSLCNAVSMAKQRLAAPGAYDPITVGRTSLDQLLAHVDRPLRARERLGADRFYDLHYARLMQDPLDEMRRLYDWAGDLLTVDVEQRMKQWLVDNPQNRFAPNRYTLEQYGLTRAEVLPLFDEYIETYGVELDER